MKLIKNPKIKKKMRVVLRTAILSIPQLFTQYPGFSGYTSIIDYVIIKIQYTPKYELSNSLL